MLVYVHGNCQALAIARMLAPVFPQWRVEFYEVFQPKITDEIERYHSIVTSADIIIAQPIHQGYRDRDDLSLDWVRANARPGASVVTFPSMYFGGQLIGWTGLAVRGYGMPYIDPALVKLFLAGLTADQIADALLSPDLYDDAFISQEIETSIAEIARREKEDGIDVPFSPYLERHGRSDQLFHVVNHPCRPAMAYMTNAVLTHLGFAGVVPEAGEDYIKYPHVPCAPAVAAFFASHAGSASAQMFHLPGESLTARQYIEKSVAHFRAINRATLEACMEDDRAKPFWGRAVASSPILQKALSSNTHVAVDWRDWNDVRLQNRHDGDFFDTPYVYDAIEVNEGGAITVTTAARVTGAPAWRPVAR